MRLNAASQASDYRYDFAAKRILLIFLIIIISYGARRRIRSGTGGAAAAGRALKNEYEVTAYVRAHAHHAR